MKVLGTRTAGERTLVLKFHTASFIQPDAHQPSSRANKEPGSLVPKEPKTNTRPCLKNLIPNRKILTCLLTRLKTVAYLLCFVRMVRTRLVLSHLSKQSFHVTRGYPFSIFALFHH
jgi:hypothetical protein